MKYSYTIGKIKGIEIQLHITFILLVWGILAWVALTDLPMFIPSLVFLIMLFGTVLLHELSHSVVSLREGVKVDSILLLPIGGMASADLTNIPAQSEFKIAIAGPMFNIIMVILVLVIAAFIPNIFPVAIESDVEFLSVMLNYPLFAFLYINAMLALFNLFVPAIPMDGGRVLRSVLAMFIGYYRATQISVKVSTVITIGMVILGFFSPSLRILLIIAPFIYLGARAEAELSIAERLLIGVPITKIITKKPLILKADLTLTQAFKTLKEKNQTSALVNLGKNNYRIISIERLIAILETEKGRKLLGKVAVPVIVLHTEDNCADAYKAVIRTEGDVVPVFKKDKLVGVVTKDSINKLYRFRAAEIDIATKGR
ncbi:MAG: hypothetical protein JXA43_02950 [Candidatus Diapherotrites archaeon]|nr:hypothetical protein [Candidatus Diapherotrites archaeon]